MMNAPYSVLLKASMGHRSAGRRLRGDDDDASVYRACLRDGFDGSGVDADDADGRRRLGDEVLDDLGLHSGVGFAPLLKAFMPVFGVLLDAGFHAD